MGSRAGLGVLEKRHKFLALPVVGPRTVQSVVWSPYGLCYLPNKVLCIGYSSFRPKELKKEGIGRSCSLNARSKIDAQHILWQQTSLVAWWSALLTTNHEVPG
jgi:hypothetical protein